jgi:hypothetical protein
MAYIVAKVNNFRTILLKKIGGRPNIYFLKSGNNHKKTAKKVTTFRLNVTTFVTTLLPLWGVFVTTLLPLKN